jgi:hypothetical protein
MYAFMVCPLTLAPFYVYKKEPTRNKQKINELQVVDGKAENSGLKMVNGYRPDSIPDAAPGRRGRWVTKWKSAVGGVGARDDWA